MTILSIALAFPLCIFPVHSLHVRGAFDTHLKVGKKCVDLTFKNPEVKVRGSVLDMDFNNVTLGMGMQIQSYNYIPADASKTGMSGDVVKINMAANTTSTYYVELWGVGGPESPGPCYQMTFFDIDCNKQGCQKLMIDTKQFSSAEYLLTSDSMLQATENDGLLTVTAHGGKSKAPKTLPVSDADAKNSIALYFEGAAKFTFSYTIPPSTTGGSLFFGGYAGIADSPAPADPELPSICGEMIATPPTTTQPPMPTTTRGPPEELVRLPCRSAWTIGWYESCSELDFQGKGIVAGWWTNMMIEFDLLGEKLLTGVKSDTIARYEISVSDDCIETPKDTRPVPPDAIHPGYEKAQVTYGYITDANSDPWWTCNWTEVHTQMGGDATFATPVKAKYAMIYWPSNWHEADLVTVHQNPTFHANFIGS